MPLQSLKREPDPLAMEKPDRTRWLFVASIPQAGARPFCLVGALAYCMHLLKLQSHKREPVPSDEPKRLVLCSCNEASIPQAGTRPFRPRLTADIGSGLCASIPHAGARPFSHSHHALYHAGAFASTPQAGARPFRLTCQRCFVRVDTCFNPSSGSQAV